MIEFFRNFRTNGNGAVTIDWIVLIAAVVGLAIAVLTSVGASAMDLSHRFATDADTRVIATN